MEHLRPEARLAAELPPDERLDRLGSDHWIGYTRAQDALDRMNVRLAIQTGQVRSENMLLVGPSNNGKSTIAEKFQRQLPRVTSEACNRQIIPVLSVQMPPDATVGRFCALLPDSLGAPVGQTHAPERRDHIEPLARLQGPAAAHRRAV